MMLLASSSIIPTPIQLTTDDIVGEIQWNRGGQVHVGVEKGSVLLSLRAASGAPASQALSRRLLVRITETQ